MTFRYFTSNILVSTPGTDAVTANDFDTIIVEAGVTLGASGAILFSTTLDSVYGIYGAPGVGEVDVLVFGTVFGTQSGIWLDDATARQSVFVGTTGRVLGEGNAVTVNGGAINVENAGLIRSDFTVVILSGTNSDVMNSGTITSVAGNAVQVSSGNVDLVNTGTIRGVGTSFADFGFGASTVWNSGLMVGSVLLGNGDDLYQGGGQVVDGSIDGSGGSDTIIGGAGDDRITDFFGNNWLAGGDGADRVQVLLESIPLSVSHLFGGVSGGADTSAMDTLQVSSFATGANIFLSSGAATGLVSRIGDNAVLAWINGFENAVGTEVADAIFGSAGANVIEGGDGGDWMVGNGGADRFVFNEAFHGEAGDQIRDFRRSEGDRIDLSGIDADVFSLQDNLFVLRTTHTNNAAGEVVITNFGNSARVDLYTNADNIVDGTFVVVYGEAGVTNLTAADFLL